VLGSLAAVTAVFRGAVLSGADTCTTTDKQSSAVNLRGFFVQASYIPCLGIASHLCGSPALLWPCGLCLHLCTVYASPLLMTCLVIQAEQALAAALACCPCPIRHICMTHNCHRMAASWHPLLYQHSTCSAPCHLQLHTSCLSMHVKCSSRCQLA
jgi:hypothetical protein